jgi:hypothetical protein
MPADFDLVALAAALDAQRTARSLSWAGVAAEIHHGWGRGAAHPLSPSTLRGIGARSVAEADGVLQMLAWLDRSPESFVPGHPRAGDPAARLPATGAGRVLRFDTAKLHAALDAERRARALPWARLAADLGVGVASLASLARGARTAFPGVMRMVGWLGRLAAEFTRRSREG